MDYVVSEFMQVYQTALHITVMHYTDGRRSSSFASSLPSTSWSWRCVLCTVLNNTLHSQLLKVVILKFNSSNIALLTMCISKCCHNRVLYWVYTDPYSFIYWAKREKIALADQYGESTLSILPYREGKYWKSTFRNWECLYDDSSRDILWNIAWALVNSLGLRPWDFPRAQATFHRISLLSS